MFTWKSAKKRNAYHRKWNKEHRASRTASARAWLQTPAGKAYQQRRNKERDPAIKAKHIKASNDRLRLDVLTHYSGGVRPRCACCSEDILDFLTLDHIGGGGGEERRKSGHRGGTAQYRSLRRAGFPPGYRVLCWNCNCTIGKRGVCPHQEMRNGTMQRKPAIRTSRRSRVYVK